MSKLGGGTKEDAFNILWSKYDYSMLGWSYDFLYKAMTKKEVLRRLKDEEAVNA